MHLTYYVRRMVDMAFRRVCGLVDHMRTIIKGAIRDNGKAISAYSCLLVVTTVPTAPLDPLPFPPLPTAVHSSNPPSVTLPFPPPPFSPRDSPAKVQPHVAAGATLQSLMTWTGPMANLPDLGNPHKLAGTAWWEDY